MDNIENLSLGWRKDHPRDKTFTMVFGDGAFAADYYHDGSGDIIIGVSPCYDLPTVEQMLESS